MCVWILTPTSNVMEVLSQYVLSSVGYPHWRAVLFFTAHLQEKVRLCSSAFSPFVL